MSYRSAGLVLLALLAALLVGSPATTASAEQAAGRQSTSYDFSSLPVERSKQTTGTPTMRYVTNAQTQQLRSDGGERRRLQVLLTVRYVGTASRVQAMMRIECQGHVKMSKEVAERTSSGDRVAVRSMSMTRNLVQGQRTVLTMRPMIEITRPGTYSCGVKWGARSASAGSRDRIEQVAGVRGVTRLSEPLLSPSYARQCFWTSYTYVGGRPSECSSSAKLRSERISRGSGTVRVTEVATKALPNAWMLAQATTSVTTCSGQQSGSNPCLAADVDSATSSTLLGRLVLLDSHGRRLTSRCVSLDGGRTTHGVSRKVHHDQVNVDLRFKVRSGCTGTVRVVSTIQVSSGAATWVHQRQGTYLNVARDRTVG